MTKTQPRHLPPPNGLPDGLHGLLTAGTSGETGDAVYWMRRQNALLIETHGVKLLPDEVVFCERLARINPAVPLNNQIEWLPLGAKSKNGMRPSNDFIWFNRGGIQVELKSISSISARKAINRIWKAVNQAWRAHQFHKQNFMIDIGDQVLTDAVREALASYNLTESGPSIDRVFVMWQQRIEEIHLHWA